MSKILLIEDDKQVRDSVSLSLESAGYEVVEAATCQEGLDGHQELSASAVISDVVSLENGGGELLRRLNHEASHVPLITLLGTLSDSYVASTKTYSVTRPTQHTLQKPFTLDELLSTVRSALTQ